MKKTELLKLIDKQSLIRPRKRRAKDIATALVMQLNIQAGSQLKYLLGQPDTANNIEAIAAWVLAKEEEGRHEIVSYKDHLVTLSQHLKEISSGGL